MSKKTLDFSLVLPLYNEGPTLGKSLQFIFDEMKKLAVSWEIIFIEDKSTDHTLSNIQKFIKNKKSCRLLIHKKNEGRGKTVADGIVASKADICGYMDVDCEVSPTYIPIFIKEVQMGSDLVVGKRFYEKGLKSMPRFLASKLYAAAVMFLLDLPVDDSEAGYKFFRRKNILPILNQVKNKNWFWDTEICVRANVAGLDLSQIPVLFKRRDDKKSTVRLIPDTIDYIINLLQLKFALLKKD